MNNQRLKILLASLIGALASFLPFYTATGGIITNCSYLNVTLTGFDSIALTTFIVFIVIILMCLLGKKNRSFSIGGRFFLVLLSLINVFIIVVFFLGNAYIYNLSDQVYNDTLSIANLNGELGSGFWMMFFMTFSIIFFSFAKRTVTLPTIQSTQKKTLRVVRE